jgi:hypothetical protein
MGQILLRMYDFVEDEKGLRGKIQLAKMTLIPSAMAAATPDTPETINKFVQAIKEITGKEPPLFGKPSPR